MRSSSLSIRVFGIYVLITGVMLIFVPLVGRPLFAILCFGLVGFAGAPWQLALFGITDILGAAWTTAALHAEQKVNQQVN